MAIVAVNRGGAPNDPAADTLYDAFGKLNDSIDTVKVAAGVANTPAGNIAATTVQTALNELDTEKLAVSAVDTDTTLAANSDSRVPSQKAIKTYADARETAAKAYADTLVVGLLDDRGNWDASGNLFPSGSGSGAAGAVLKGDLWTISVAGTLGSVAVGVGDVVRALVNTPGQTAGNWVITENNIGYVPANDTLVLKKASNLSDLASVSTALDNLGFSANSKSLVAAANYAAMRALLGLIVGTDVQPYDSDLLAIAALASAADKLPYATGAQTWALTDFTATARSLLDDASTSAMLSTLGLSANGKSLVTAADYAAMRALLGVEPAASPLYGNLLDNPDGQFNQRAPASSADSTFGHDRWKALTQTGTIAVSTVSDAENGSPFMMRLTQSQASAQRMGYIQFLPSTRSKLIRGKSVMLSARIKCSASQAIRYAILEWTGTADTVTGDVVNDWTSSTYTAGNFFLASNVTVTAVGSITPSAATLTDITALSATLGSSGNNIGVFFWTEGTAAQNITLDIKAQLEIGSVATTWKKREYAAELANVLQFYRKSFPLATAPATNAGSTGAVLGAQLGGAVSQLFPSGWVTFGALMSKTPTITIYNPDAANNQIRAVGAGADWSSSAIQSAEPHGFILSGTSPGAAGQTSRFHFSAEAEIF